MPILLFPLRSVPDDEADDVRDLLTENEINYYETNAGNWGISMPAIWLPDEQQHEQAYYLIQAYQKERQQVVHAEYIQFKKAGKENTFFKNLWHNPVQTLVFLTGIAAVVYISVKLVLGFS